MLFRWKQDRDGVLQSIQQTRIAQVEPTDPMREPVELDQIDLYPKSVFVKVLNLEIHALRAITDFRTMEKHQSALEGLIQYVSSTSGVEEIKLNKEVEETVMAEAASLCESLVDLMVSIHREASVEVGSFKATEKLVSSCAEALGVDPEVLADYQERIAFLKKDEQVGEKRERKLSMTVVEKWTTRQVANYIKKLGLGNLVETFNENQIDGKTFLGLNYEDLQEDLGLDDEQAISTILSAVSEIKAVRSQKKRMKREEKPVQEIGS